MTAARQAETLGPLFDPRDGENVRAEHARRQGKREALRGFLSDHKWHAAALCAAVGGSRYGGRVLELRRGVGGAAPLTVHVRHVGLGLYEYRAADAADTAREPQCIGPCCKAEVHHAG